MTYPYSLIDKSRIYEYTFQKLNNWTQEVSYFTEKSILPSADEYENSLPVKLKHPNEVAIRKTRFWVDFKILE